MIRYWNNEVLGDIDSVLESIRMTLDVVTTPSPQPSPLREREFDEDVKAGRLDFPKAEVEQAKREGTLKEL